ncbi:DUF6299 family protein [Streptomyces sp. NPDC012888]|uniref:DUF6299 family protein n=1 Tax=Streptomyces sp. NPDC012888 TaxID=3364855 RepID=UPI0036C97F0B
MRISPRRVAVAALSTLAAMSAFTTPAGAGAFGDEISVLPYGHISENSVTLYGTYRCDPASPRGVQIQATVVQDGTRLAFGGEEAVCDGEQHKWSATGTLRMTPDVHPGGAGAEVRLQHASVGSSPFSVHVSHLAEQHRDIELVPRG